jgi:hypothetical protein
MDYEEVIKKYEAEDAKRKLTVKQRTMSKNKQQLMSQITMANL